MAMVRPRRRDRREQDRSRRGRDRKMDDVLGRESLLAETDREQRHNRHAAPNAEQTRQEADERAERHEGDDQRGIHAVMACAWRASRWTTIPPGLPGGRGARWRAGMRAHVRAP